MGLKRKLSSIGSANAKTLTKNFSALAVLQAMRYLIPFIVLPYVTPIIGVTHFGEIAVAYAIALIFQTVVNFSFDFIGARDVARNREDMEKVSEIVSTSAPVSSSMSSPSCCSAASCWPSRSSARSGC